MDKAMAIQLALPARADFQNTNFVTFRF